MGWYIRKSINIGPVRFNLSKSGIGTSVGVKGFRIGIRPNGSSYLHAGRYGLYYREELGGQKILDKRQSYSTDDMNFSSDTRYYNKLGSRDFKTTYKKELVQAMSHSYQCFRFDYLTIAISIFLVILWICQREYICIYWGVSDIWFNILSVILLLICILAVLYVVNWETNRRRIDLIYLLAELISKKIVMKKVVHTADIQ